MVAGDLVNTASRVQSLADPGTVLVGEATRRATDQTVAYEDAGSHELKGKVGLTPLWRALRVVSGARGSLKSAGLEAPFVGRDRELRQIKELFHACADEGRAHLVSITGIAGIGKSRLGWEFYKYFDGIAQITYWHRGRCLSYGEGVTYWALADMVRMRARIAEDEDEASALAKLGGGRRGAPRRPGGAPLRRAAGSRICSDSRTRAGGTSAKTCSRRGGCSSSGSPPSTPWSCSSRTCSGRMLRSSTSSSTCSSGAATRRSSSSRRRGPSCSSSRPTWGAGHRNFSSIYLEPLPEHAMEELLAGLVPGLPEELRAQILAGRRASRCTRSRPCACCSTGARSCRRAPSIGRRERSSRSRSRRRSTR